MAQEGRRGAERMEGKTEWSAQWREKPPCHIRQQPAYIDPLWGPIEDLVTFFFHLSAGVLNLKSNLCNPSKLNFNRLDHKVFWRKKVTFFQHEVRPDSHIRIFFSLFKTFPLKIFQTDRHFICILQMLTFGFVWLLYFCEVRPSYQPRASLSYRLTSWKVVQEALEMFLSHQSMERFCLTWWLLATWATLTQSFM